MKLSDGTDIPQLGLGVLFVPDGETEQVVGAALELGYRHVDTAQLYHNEAGVGRALARSGLARDELYVTTKLHNGFHEPAKAKASLAESLEKLGLDRVDLFLVHWPLPTLCGGDYVSTWQALIELREEGLTTSIGVSNFQPAHLDRIVAETAVAPVVNQIEVHPYFANETVRAATRRHGALVEGWSPLARGAVLTDPAVASIARERGRTPSQVVLRWHLDRGDVVFPKSANRARLAENLAATEFTLSPAERARLDALDRGEAGRTGPHPDTLDVIPG
ncbi:aldo/keto reductase [Amycolatopsis rubida]|uniref:2,5-diketo-D-gluconate reductase A n=1 Tax=Amycolatopsis rubida TaxID=112413 RepID=A0A1I5S393_9PSEU|nr:aldo/keto reductase [Amycolatopsis rubida]SFP65117.1 2,5-diketo-D-gluconate reductase A [Amycolatopsis rubida]